ncbi:branched-chain amino acid ABC transporter permease [Rhizobium rhizogenes]|uniref:branched-chain amino acid ABC transporter permease n=1 Tax=Rhizobium rhizogenes TaxID=359 RepID=UPI0015722993|nr:branched-chain amino acid ABC transporter permease [Rhizobium rhizogenes]NTH22891.1 branched-chain amino acid ABC transporter permease [Rhizobium rhizogenes]NTH35920.1 branched-chain amino acid ABC transporter permease [Rhizobium rhizogenes]
MYYLDLTIQGLVFGSMYALMALGLTLIYGLMRILHVAHSIVFTLGAYICVVVTNSSGSLWLGAFVAIALAAIVGVLIYRLIYEPLLSRPPLVPLIASVGLTILMEDAFRIVFGNLGLSFDNNPWLYETVDFAGLSVGLLQVTMFITAAVVLSGFAAYVNFNRVGISWRATLSNPQMATSFGINVGRVHDVNFAVGSAFAGVAGVLVALLNNYVEPTMGMVVGYKTLAIIVLGGLGNMAGALVGSLLLGVAESFGTIYLTNVLDRDAIAAVFLILVLMLRPHGLLRKRVA